MTNEIDQIDFARVAGLAHDMEKAARAVRREAVRCESEALAEAIEDVHDLAARALDLVLPPRGERS